MSGPFRIDQEQVVEAPQTNSVLSKEFVKPIKVGDTTPSVLNLIKFKFQNTSATTITNFDDGQVGQEITLLGDGNTTIANNSNIVTNAGADKLLDDGVVFKFIKYPDGKWHELQGGSSGSSVSVLDDLSDVVITSPTDGDILSYDSGSGDWINVVESAHALDDLTDVVITSPSDGDVLTYDNASGDWINSAPSGASSGITKSSYDVSSAATLDIDITSYSLIELVGWLAPATDTVQLGMQLSNDGGSTFHAGTNYAYGYSFINTAFTTSGIGGNGASAAAMYFGGNVGNSTNEYIEFTIKILNSSISGVRTRIATLASWTNPTTDLITSYGGGELKTAEVNDYVRLLFSSGNIASGHVEAYLYT